MQRLLVVALISLLTLPVSAQLYDDFSDGEIASNPVWSGDTDDFVVNAGAQLQLNAPQAGVSSLSAGLQFPDSVHWQLFFKMDFAPSTSNLLRIYLMTDTTDFDLASGYMLEIGENGANDPLRFYTLEEGSAFLIALSDGVFGTDPSEATLDIRRDGGGNWTFSAMTGNGMSVAFSAFDDSTPPSQGHYFGLQCVYSDTRKDKFFFDDILIEEIIPDLTAPTLLSVSAESPTSVLLSFDEPLLPASVIPANITLSPSIGMAQSATLINESTLQATFSSPFQNGTTYTVSVTGIRDLAGNTAPEQLQSFTYVELSDAGAFDILINELLPDPSPVIGLPNAEFLELYNPTDRTFDLSSVNLHVGTTTTACPTFLLEPDAYVIITDAADVADFTPFGDVVGVDLPTLNNTGAEIRLTHVSGTQINRVVYSDDWYRDSNKDDGGWSLELINPKSPCVQGSNWIASVNLTGGTPGSPNSVLDMSFEDTSGPILRNLFPDPAGLQIHLAFDELLGPATPAITLTPAIGISDIVTSDQSATIILNQALQTSVLYTIRVEGVEDCLGNIAQAFDRSFGLPSTPAVGDLLINEILYDPQTGGQRFLELYNTSSKFLSSLELNIAEIEGGFADLTAISAEFLILPQSYVVFSADPADVISRYPTHDPAVIVETALPALDRDAGIVAVTDKTGSIVDMFSYSNDLHNPLLEITQGVSLERVSLVSPTDQAGNWHSAAQSAGFATPGLPNSQAISPGDPGDLYSIVNSTFSPDGDGFEDILLIQFGSPGPGSVANITVFDTHGREIRRLLRNELIGVGSLAQWDGTTHEGLRATVGAYILLIETFDSSGTKRAFKEVAVLATRF